MTFTALNITGVVIYIAFVATPSSTVTFKAGYTPVRSKCPSFLTVRTFPNKWKNFIYLKLDLLKVAEFFHTGHEST